MVVAVIVWTLGELVQWPVAASYTAGLAPPGRSGRYAGARSFAYGAALFAAPLIGVTLYDAAPAASWPVLGLAGVGAAVVLLTGRRQDGGGVREPGHPGR